jgi:amidohydrolase
VVNDAECAAIVERAASGFLGAERVAEARMTGSDDMAYFLEAAPGAYFLLGGAPSSGAHPHHSPQFDFDEACLPIGVEVGLRVLEGAGGS